MQHHLHVAEFYLMHLGIIRVMEWRFVLQNQVKIQQYASCCNLYLCPLALYIYFVVSILSTATSALCRTSLFFLCQRTYSFKLPSSDTILVILFEILSPQSILLTSLDQVLSLVLETALQVFLREFLIHPVQRLS